jgi:hypothetical protein
MTAPATDTTTRDSWPRITFIGVLLAGATALTAYSTTQLQIFTHADAPALAWATGGAWVLVVVATVLLFRVHGRAAVVLVLIGSVAVGGAALSGPPNTSTDSARYAWDGIVQDAGISPYAHLPVADELASLRPSWLFPSPVADGTSCTGLRIKATTAVPSGMPLCTALNRPHVPTIYPPVAEAYFAAVRSVVPTTAQYWPMQVAGFLVSLATTVTLLVGMRRRGMNPRWAALWGWSPFVASEAVTNSHVDVLGAALILAATFAAAPAVGSRLARLPRIRPFFVGVLIGLAVAVKFIPAIAAPPLLRRTPIRILLAAVATFALVYVPYVMVTGWQVIGYLPGYLNEEGYDDGTRFALIGLIAHGAAATIIAGVLIVVIAAIIWWRTDPTRPWPTQVVLVGSVLLIVSPGYEWYALVLIPFIALSARWEWLAVPLALTVRTLFGPNVAPAAVGAAAIVVVAVTIVRRWHPLLRRLPLTIEETS